MENQKLLDGLENFFQKDMSIKQDLLNLAPNEMDDLTEEQRIEYIDKLYASIRDFKADFVSSLTGLEFPAEVMEAVTRYFDRLTEKFAIGKYDSGITRETFQKGFSNMDSKLVEDVKNTFVGYTDRREGIVQLIDRANTINELLHILHQYVMNNEELLQSLPEVATKENDVKYPITLRGTKTEFSEGIFQDFPDDLDVGWTDIVSLKEKVIMMVRDRGHALTIDITPSQDKVTVRYFVPKLCNREMVEALPGVDRAHITDSGATGVFECSREELSSHLFDFIERVPMDSDMPEFKHYKAENSVVINEKGYVTSVISHGEEVATFGGDQVVNFTTKDGKLSVYSATEEKKEDVFSSEDAKDVALQKGTEGRTISRIKLLQQKIKDVLTNLKNKLTRNGEEVTKDDKSERD